MSRNLLDQETSPYLLQHRANPVHWRPWGPAALAEAKAGDKPILLSVGYAACHWCHVMAHESFEDEATARLMNELYIPIKVDREERPDIDLIYQTALANLGEQGGWPLTMFLTPQGEPFWGGTYFPPAPRYGRPGFKEVLVGVAAAYDHEPDKIEANVIALKAALAQSFATERGSLPPASLPDEAAVSLLRAIDPRHGGLTGAPKFPQAPLFAFLWRAALRTGDDDLHRAVTVTLEHMSQGGIYDHLGGGFARYSTDPTWLVPHFEKMLYDNAQLIELLTAAWQHGRSPLHAQRVAETTDWLAREMMAEHGAFAATLDADSEGQEGKYYVWHEAEIDQALSPDQAHLIKQTYDVTAEGNWEGVTILHRNHPGGAWRADLEPALAEARSILLARRQRRTPPGRDDKILADWNGMMIAALASASFVFARPDWLALAKGAFAAIGHHLVRDDRLAHSFRHGRLQAEAMLDDYAQMARAALALHEVTGEPGYLDQAIRWVETLDRHYWDAAEGGYFFTADDAPGLILRTKSALDHATPSGNGVMVEVLARLHHHTGEDRYRQRAEAIVAVFSPQLAQSFPHMSALLNGWELLDQAVEVVLVGRDAEAAFAALRTAVAESPQPNLVLTQLTTDRPLPASHPAAGKYAVLAAGSAAAFVCRQAVCSPPVYDPPVLRSNLAAR